MVSVSAARGRRHQQVLDCVDPHADNAVILSLDLVSPRISRVSRLPSFLYRPHLRCIPQTQCALPRGVGMLWYGLVNSVWHGIGQLGALYCV